MIAAAARYFGGVFVIAFVLGTVRTVWLAPRIGATAAVLAEVPLILIASILVAIPIVRRDVAMTRQTAVAMGVIAFAMLMIAEVALSVVAFGMTVEQWARSLVAMPGPIGLAGQVIFAFVPMIVRELLVRRSSPPRPR